MCASQVANIAAQLSQEQQLDLGISIYARSCKETALPHPEILKLLKGFLHHINTCSIPHEQPAASDPEWIDQHAYAQSLRCSYQHANFLQGSKVPVCTLQLRYAGWNAGWNDEVSAFNQCMVVLPSLTHLTKLHLAFVDKLGYRPVNFEPLAQLSLLEDLAVQCIQCAGPCYLTVFGPVCCKGVLESNAQSLRSVILSGFWSAAAYSSLQSVLHLDTLSIHTTGLDIHQANAFAGIQADSFRLTLHRQLWPDVVTALERSQPQVHKLTKWGSCQKQPLSLPALRSLQSLTLVAYMPYNILYNGAYRYMCEEDMAAHLPFTGEALPALPGLTQLILIDCPGITSNGLEHAMGTALPALIALSIQATTKKVGLVLFVRRIWSVLYLGQNLCFIDLSGVSGPLARGVRWYELELQSRQCRSEAPPKVVLLLPSENASLSCKPECALDIVDSMFVPDIHKARGCRRVIQMEIAKPCTQNSVGQLLSHGCSISKCLG